jgi:mono/diheme cytochrome c family protein
LVAVPSLSARFVSFSFSALWLALVLSFGCARKQAPAGELVFKTPGVAPRTVSLAALADHVALRTVETSDPYYKQTKRFLALPISAALAFAFDQPAETLKQKSFVLHARDGYTVPIDGARLMHADAFLAIDDIDAPGFLPIGPRGVSPAPAYLVWQGSAYQDIDAYPRPWQLSEIEIVDGERLFPHLVPQGQASGSLAMRGYSLFRGRCVHCHAINREGGSMGPDLNVPQSIVAYRPEPQIRDYIRNPLTFRYGVMPANPDLTDADLDALIAYFQVMAAQPYDPHAKLAP